MFRTLFLISYSHDTTDLNKLSTDKKNFSDRGSNQNKKRETTPEI